MNQFISFYSVFNLQLIEQTAQWVPPLSWQLTYNTTSLRGSQLFFKSFSNFFKKLFQSFFRGFQRTFRPLFPPEKHPPDRADKSLSTIELTPRSRWVCLLNYIFDFLSTVFSKFFKIFSKFFYFYFRPTIYCVSGMFSALFVRFIHNRRFRCFP